MTLGDRGPRKSLDVQLTPLSINEWRVSDLREPWDSPHALIGFIGKTADTSYEVLEFGDPMRSIRVSSMDEAISVFTRPGLSIVDTPASSVEEPGAPLKSPTNPEPPLPPGTLAMTTPVFSAIGY
jgi:hypothetical protein